MATGGSGGQKKGPGFNPFSDYAIPLNVSSLGGGALVGAIALFSIKKLYDYLSSSTSHEVVLTSPVKPPDISPFIPDVIADHVPNPSESHRISASHVDPRRGSGSSVDPRRSSGSSVDPLPWRECVANETFASTSPVLETKLSPSGSNHTPPSPSSPRSSSGNASPTNHAISQNDDILYKLLVEFHSRYAQIDMSELTDALEIVDEMKNLFMKMFVELLPNHPIRELQEAGDAAEGLLVIAPDHFEFRIPLTLDPDMWEIIDAGDSILSANGYAFIKRKNLEFFSPGSSRYDKYMIGGYLAPQKICTAIQDMTHRVGKWSDIRKVQASVLADEIQLTVVGEDGNNILIDFIPDVRINDDHVMATPHPRSNVDPSFTNLWRSAFNEQEKNKLLSSLEVNPHGCLLICLQIFRALQFRYPEQLGIYSSCVGKSVLMYLMDVHEDWSSGALAARFLDILNHFQSCLQARTLPHYFRREYNLLHDISEFKLDATNEFIDHVMLENNFSWFLRVD